MIQNFHSFFEAQHEYYLDEISYKRVEGPCAPDPHELKCTDELSVDYKSGIVKLTVTRTLIFNPDDLFRLSISFGAILNVKEDKIDALDWGKANLADEFRDNGQFVLLNLLSRISMLVSSITSSFGQMPIIVPPAVAQN